MSFLDNLKMGPKLLGSYLLLAALGAMIGLVGIKQIHAIDDADTRLYEKITIPLGEMGEIRQIFQRQRINVRDAIMTGNAEKYGGIIKDLIKEGDKIEETFQKTILTDKGREDFKKFKDANADYDKDVERILALVEAGKIREADALMRGDAFKTNQEVQKRLDELQASKLSLAKATSDGNTALANSASTMMMIIMGVSVVFGLITGWLITRSIKEPLAKGVDMMNEMAKGHLSTRLHMDRKDEIGQLAGAMDGFTDNLQSIVGGLQQISNGDLSREWVAADDKDEIAPALKQVRGNLQALVADAALLNQAAVEGKLATRADATRHQGDYRKIVQGVNDCLDAVIGPLNVAAGYVDRISKGDIPPKITDKYNGDFNEIKNNLNQCVDAVNALVADAAMLSVAAVEGKLATRADATKHQGDFRKIVQGVDDCLDAVIGPLNVTATYVDQISKGVIPPVITDNYNGDFNVIKTNLNNMVKMMSQLLEQTDIIIKGAAEGELDKRANADLFVGGWNQLVTGVNAAITNIVNPMNVTADYVDKVAKGIIPPTITTEYKGQYNVIKGNLNNMVKMMSDLLEQTVLGATRFPETFHLHPKLEGFIKKRRDALANNGTLDWAFAEAVAFGSLALEGIPVRLSGQDCGRGTFSQRHLSFYDFQDGSRHIPLQHLAADQAPFVVLDSSLSEFGVLGFEYGYSIADPNTLILWEAQFGDFSNGAQIIIDQFITTGEQKWGQTSGLVMLLPHGYEGQGPEHSSARIERFLTLCAEDNMRVANCTTPAQYFHILRRQAVLPLKPLVIFTPKSLLRSAKAVSTFADLTDGSFQEVIPDDLDPKGVRKLVFSSGKVYYDLLAAREAKGCTDVALIRMEELYPFPAAKVQGILAQYAPGTPIVWCQEEPRNMGPWRWIFGRFLDINHRMTYAGRAHNASPAAGSPKRHAEEHKRLVDEALA